MVLAEQFPFLDHAAIGQVAIAGLAAGGAVACGLVRFFYDELLVRLDPRGPRIDA